MKQQQKKGSQIEKSSTSNSTSIQSKLLGTNVNEINIEKLREQKYTPPQFLCHGRLSQGLLTREYFLGLLKTVSNKFTLDIIFILDLSGQQLGNIDLLQECTSLLMLNLANNQLKDLFALQNLKELLFLNVSKNQIHSLDYIRNLTKLRNLMIQNNQLKSVKAISGLEDCIELKTLYLQNINGSEPNPLCDLENYRSIILDNFQQLRRLDGIPRDYNRFNQGKELLGKKQKEIKVEIQSTGIWFTTSFPRVEPAAALKIDGEDKIKSGIDTCNKTATEIEMKLQLLKIN